MTLVIPQDGAVDVLQYVVNKATPQDLILKLFQNNITPADTDTAATYTEATFTGYSAVTLTGSSWGTPVAGLPSSIAYPQQSFTSSAGSQNQNIYGVFAVRVTSGKIFFAELFSGAPFNIANNGDAIKYTPQMTQ